jgi:uncharacterized protein YecE (DUF72 family)
MAAMIRIGTASWTDPGFVEDWYPAKLPAGRRLRWYAEHFNFVEVNATFYAIPVIRTVERWCNETPANFIFDVKLPKLFSRHAMRPQFFPADLRSRLPLTRGKVELTPETEEVVANRLLREIAPLFEAGKFGCFLLQMSPAFRPMTDFLSDLDRLKDLLAPHSMAVELRNRDWVTGTRLSETLDYFSSRRTTFVLVDAPNSEHFTVMPGMNRVTNPALGYFRFHGRNEKGYVSGRSVAERFDYQYPDTEVDEIVERVEEVLPQVSELHLVANNNRSNYAPRLARQLQEKLSGKAGVPLASAAQAQLI